ncbi:O-antigen ligase family protein [Neotamlana laminarinivorans]|uniref:O-antigen ligase family protein n=1 Tax=Neotamlana laminarinivorans TaxID=2883124 RepID=A0A9X1L129_9FLAO|nr:O-antigen ligase family protein [Tamlana laminarinivorans]MCB4798328.1 O-antigen ligase family protein [Tamlana laminarinivorans]
MLKKIGYWVLVIGLLGTVSNLIFISPLPTLVSPIFIFVGLLMIKKPKKVTFWLTIFLLYATISVLIYHPKSLIDFDFYRYDGNLYISYLPILAFSFLAYDYDIEKRFKQFLLFTIIINLIGLVVLGINPIDHNYHGFFKAHNAIGGFMAFITIIAFVFAHQKRSRFYKILAFLAFLFLWLSGSRGSILGVVFSIIFYFIYLNKYYRKLNFVLLTIFFIINFIAALLLYNYGLYTKLNLSKNGEKYMKTHIRSTEGNVGAKTMNIYTRIHWTWGRATNCLIVSPFFGTGFGSMNDWPLNFKGVNHIIAFNNPDDYFYDPSHAHHSYFHFLGEFGIIGFLIFVAFWWNVYKYLERNDQNKIVQLILIMSYFNLTIMSFTEHRITTPSNALPFVISLSLYIIYNNYKNKYASLPE